MCGFYVMDNLKVPDSNDQKYRICEDCADCCIICGDYATNLSELVSSGCYRGFSYHMFGRDCTPYCEVYSHYCDNCVTHCRKFKKRYDYIIISEATECDICINNVVPNAGYLRFAVDGYPYSDKEWDAINDNYKMKPEFMKKKSLTLKRRNTI